MRRNAFNFLKYERPYIVLYLFGFLTAVAVFYTDPRTRWSWATFGYALSLTLVLLAGFVVYRYMRTLHAIRRIREEDAEPLSLEAEVCHQTIERMEREHIRALNEVHARQQDHYNFIVSWFHEIKIPISVLHLMLQTEIDKGSLEEETTRIEHYVDQALYYAKLDSFHQDYELVNCELEPIVKGLVKHHAKTFIARRIRIQLQLEPLTVQSDAKWLHFIINQLLTNSLKYTGEHGEIAIAARVTPDEKQLVIRDTGIGIDPKDLPRIFNRGFTGTTGRTHTKSTGMGLYLAQELARKLGHSITCTSEPGRYTEMVIHFPLNHDRYFHTLSPG